MRNLIPTEVQLAERYVIGSLEQAKAIVISYNNWMSCKTEVFFSLTVHYCTGTNRNNTHIGMSPTTATNGVYLYKTVSEVVDNFGLEAKIVGITSDGVGNIRVCREALNSKHSNESVFHHPNTSYPWSALCIYWQGLASLDCNISSQMMVRLTPN